MASEGIRLLDFVVGIHDPRVTGRTDHDLGDILVLALCAVMAGAEGWDDTEDWGLLAGAASHVNADSTEAPSANTRSDALSGRDRPMGPLSFRTLVALASQTLEADGQRYPLAAGMQVSAEIHLGTRTVLEYLLSPVRKAFHEAGRER